MKNNYTIIKKVPDTVLTPSCECKPLVTADALEEKYHHLYSTDAQTGTSGTEVTS